MSVPQRIQRKRTKGWKMPDGAVYVGRPGRWGNPFRVGGYFAIGLGAFSWIEASPGFSDSRFTLIKDAAQAVEFYREWVKRFPPYKLSELRGKDLACWCKVGEPCHADILLEIANA
jgi:Domain of unknown function (DUF4326)